MANDIEVIGDVVAIESSDIALRPVAAMADAQVLLRQMLEGGAMEVLIAVGQIRAATVAAAVSDIIAAQAYAKIAHSRGYMNLPYRDDDGQARHVASLEEFTKVFLGRSARRCQELAANLSLLGAELYEAAEVVGFRARDYAALKALPPDDQAAVKEALAAEDKDRAIETLAELVARQAEEKAKLKAEREAAEAKAAESEAKAADLQADSQAKDRIIGETKSKLRRLQDGELPVAQADAVIGLYGNEAGRLLRDSWQLFMDAMERWEAVKRLGVPEELEGPAYEAHLAGVRRFYAAVGGHLKIYEDRYTRKLSELNQWAADQGMANEELLFSLEDEGYFAFVHGTVPGEGQGEPEDPVEADIAQPRQSKPRLVR